MSVPNSNFTISGAKRQRFTLQVLQWARAVFEHHLLYPSFPLHSDSYGYLFFFGKAIFQTSLVYENGDWIRLKGRSHCFGQPAFSIFKIWFYLQFCIVRGFCIITMNTQIHVIILPFSVIFFSYYNFIKHTFLNYFGQRDKMIRNAKYQIWNLTFMYIYINSFAYRKRIITQKGILLLFVLGEWIIMNYKLTRNPNFISCFIYRKDEISLNGNIDHNIIVINNTTRLFNWLFCFHIIFFSIRCII